MQYDTYILTNDPRTTDDEAFVTQTAQEPAYDRATID
jgi:hypothetical protein